MGSPYAINNDTRPDARQVFVIGWTGMRGVIALAAAISLPQGRMSPFPHRNLIVFLTFSVILVTFVAQGLTLAPLIRALGLATTSGPDCEEQEARRMMLEAALAQLQNRDRTKDLPVLLVYMMIWQSITRSDWRASAINATKLIRVVGSFAVVTSIFLVNFSGPSIRPAAR